MCGNCANLVDLSGDIPEIASKLIKHAECKKKCVKYTKYLQDILVKLIKKGINERKIFWVINWGFIIEFKYNNETYIITFGQDDWKECSKHEHIYERFSVVKINYIFDKDDGKCWDYDKIISEWNGKIVPNTNFDRCIKESITSNEVVCLN